MANNTDERTIAGKVIGYKKGLSLVLAKSLVLVKVENGIVSIPVDYRQEKFIEKEYPPGTTVPIGVRDGKWHIRSRPARGPDMVMRMDHDCVVNYQYV